jgi:hypothetical protein
MGQGRAPVRDEVEYRVKPRDDEDAHYRWGDTAEDQSVSAIQQQLSELKEAGKRRAARHINA